VCYLKRKPEAPELPSVFYLKGRSIMKNKALPKARLLAQGLVSPPPLPKLFLWEQRIFPKNNLGYLLEESRDDANELR
jgi:hypothetical protein